jgi:hypothetical protein
MKTPRLSSLLFLAALAVTVTNARVASGQSASPPVIITQPASQTVIEGANVAFNAIVSGSAPLSFQWEFDGAPLPAPVITTIAGNFDLGGTYGGDGCPATNAAMYQPVAVALDRYGNVFIADLPMSMIRPRIISPARRRSRRTG